MRRWILLTLVVSGCTLPKESASGSFMEGYVQPIRIDGGITCYLHGSSGISCVRDVENTTAYWQAKLDEQTQRQAQNLKGWELVATECLRHHAETHGPKSDPRLGRDSPGQITEEEIWRTWMRSREPQDPRRDIR